MVSLTSKYRNTRLIHQLRAKRAAKTLNKYYTFARQKISTNIVGWYKKTEIVIPRLEQL